MEGASAEVVAAELERLLRDWREGLDVLAEAFGGDEEDDYMSDEREGEGDESEA